MAIQLSSVDLHFLHKELTMLCKSRFDSAYEYEDGLLFRFHKPNVGPIDLFVQPPSWLYVTNKPGGAQEPGSFVTHLRKMFDGCWVDTISQPLFHRVITFELNKREANYVLIFEWYDKGNIIVCDKSTMKIVACQTEQTWANRTVKRGEVYHIEPIISLSEAISQKVHLAVPLVGDEVISKYIATTFQIGGWYAQVVCAHLGVKSIAPASSVSLQRISEGVAWLFEQPVVAAAVGIEGVEPTQIKHIIGVDQQIDGFMRKAFPTISAAYAYTNVKVDTRADEVNAVAKKIKAIVDVQRKTISQQHALMEDATLIANTLQQQSHVYQEIIDCAKANMSLETIQGQFPSVKIKKVNVTKKTVEIEL